MPGSKDSMLHHKVSQIRKPGRFLFDICWHITFFLMISWLHAVLRFFFFFHWSLFLAVLILTFIILLVTMSQALNWVRKSLNHWFTMEQLVYFCQQTSAHSVHVLFGAMLPRPMICSLVSVFSSDNFFISVDHYTLFHCSHLRLFSMRG